MPHDPWMSSSVVMVRVRPRWFSFLVFCRGPEPEPEDPQIELVVVRIQAVEVAFAVHGRPPGLAALQRPERARRLRDAGGFDTLGHLLEGHGLAALEQRHQEPGVVVRLATARDGFEGRGLDAQQLTLCVRLAHRV